MINFISSWTQGIIVSVIIATIIEMILPNNGNGKYVKSVIGVFVLFSIISPIIGKFRENKETTNLDSYMKDISSDTIQVSNKPINNEDAIRRMYEENLKIDIKSKITQKGYCVGEIYLDIANNNEYTLNKITVKIVSRNDNNNKNGNVQNVTTIVENVENIKVSLGGSGRDENKQETSILNESEKRRLKEYLSSVYEVKECNIFVS